MIWGFWRMNGFFSVKNFDRFQHYKDRSPPWIRLYNSLLDDYDFGQLPDASKAHLLAIWLLASRYENKIPLDPEWVGRRINATERVDLALLIKSGFLVPDQGCSDTLAGGKQDARPEERRAETEQSREEPLPADAGGERRERISIERASTPTLALVPEEPEPSAPPRYPPEFQELWDCYRETIGNPNAKKWPAFCLWKKLNLADRADCERGLTLYCEWLTEERKKRTDYPAQHLDVWIRGRGWESYLEAAA